MARKSKTHHDRQSSTVRHFRLSMDKLTFTFHSLSGVLPVFTAYANNYFVNVFVEELSPLDYAENSWSNRSSEDAPPNTFWVFPQMLLVPNFGEAGLPNFSASENTHIQSCNYTGAEALVDMADTAVYDIAHSRCFRQSGNGDIPLPRRMFYSVRAMATDNSTYEM